MYFLELTFVKDAAWRIFIRIRLVEIGDEIKFCFKKNQMVGEIGYGGHIVNTRITKEDGVVVETLSDENLPLADFVERSVFKRGPSRRTYSIRVLETRYTLQNREDASEPQKPSARQSKNNASQSPRSFRGNQSLANAGGATEEKAGCAKRFRGHHRRLAHDSTSCRVFRALGDDLLVKWLTPKEVYNIEIAFDWDYDWGRSWHGGKVKNKAVAARIQFDLQQGLQAEQLLAKYNRDLAFSALWYLVGVGEIERLANKYKHYKTVRKLCRFLS